MRARAALFVTDLHGPRCDAALEDEVQRWIAADPSHAAAFELASKAWEQSAPARKPTLPAIESRHSQSAWLGAAAAACLALMVVYLWSADTFRTGAGELRRLTLSDGTQVTLSANSRLAVHFDNQSRQVTLERGEALFEVAHNQPHPFIVRIGRRQVIAIGTIFDVRREENDAFAVTLLEGRVSIGGEAPSQAAATASNAATVLEAGERLRFDVHAAKHIDRPPVERITAWQRGELIFEDASLREAAAEFTRYGATRVVIDEAVPARYRVGGVFRIGDPESFALAMSRAYPVRVTHDQKTIILSPR